MALFISLVVLLIVTIVGVSAVRTTTLEERMAANARDRDIAFQAAEAALLSAEDFIEGLEPADIPSFLANTAGRYVPAAPGDVPRWDEVDWDGDATIPQPADPLPGVYDQPRFIIEHITQLAPDEDELNLSNLGGTTGAITDIFRVTARAQGGTRYAEVMLQSSYGKVL
ncbi:MAG: PilX N-terminal domain-containing pilus assembly protein [Gammaproteobacteria bacterium]